MQPQDKEASSSTAAFQVGETVSVRRYGNAVIASGLITEPGHQFFGRYAIRYLDGKLYHAHPASLRRFEQPPARVLVTETTDHYRAAAQAFCHPGDMVLEVGSSYGTTCELIHQRGAQVVGIDKGADLVAESRGKYPHLRFEVLDAFDVQALSTLSPTGSFDKIFVDIGGIAELHTVMCLLGTYFRAFRRSVLVVKNKYLKTLLHNTQVYVPPLEQRDHQQANKQQGSAAAAAAGAGEQQAANGVGAAGTRHQHTQQCTDVETAATQLQQSTLQNDVR